MDDSEQILEAFSQDECIEWVENRNVDLRQLARSPHMPATPALLGTQQTTSASAKLLPRSSEEEMPAADLVKNLDKHYSPKQEIAHLMDPGAIKEDSQHHAAHEAPTQPQANVAKSSDTLGMRHGRRRRDSSVTKYQPKKLKRSNTDPTALKGRRRPRSSGSTTSDGGKQVSAGASSDGVDFEDLFKELDHPRMPLHPTKVNMPGEGESKRAATKSEPVRTNAPLVSSGSTRNAVPPMASMHVKLSSFTNTTVSKEPQSDAAVSNRAILPKPNVTTAQAFVPNVHNPYPKKTGGSAPPTESQPMPATISNNNSAPTTYDALEDDFNLSEEDWAQIDALTLQASSRRKNAPPTKNDNIYSTKDWKAIQTFDESLARAIGHPSVVSEEKRNDASVDDFPIFDFEAMDRAIAERNGPAKNNSLASTQFRVQIPLTDAPVRNQVSPTFDPQCSFIAFSRYKVVRTDIDMNTYTKIVFVKEWQTEMLKDQMKNTIHHSSSSECVKLDVNDTDGCVFLRGEWYHTHVDAEDIVHLCSLSGKFRTDVGALPVILDTSLPQGSGEDDDLVLVVHPDRLIPPTTISETVTCSRRAVLRMRLGSSGISSKAALFGTMRHELFESCMSNQDFSWPTAKVFADNIVRRNASSLVGCGIRESEARAEVLKVVPQIQRFATDYTTFSSKPGTAAANSSGSRLKGNGLQPDMQFVAQSVRAIEEAVVCPELGLKGNLDITVSATTSSLPSNGINQTASSAGLPQTSLMSIELKTGHNQNPQNAHMAQLALYTLMLRVRRGPNRPDSTLPRSSAGRETQGACESGMLLYLNHENYRAMHVSPMISEVKSLVGQRNLVASELTKVSRPRGVVLSYEEDNEKKSAIGKEKGSMALLPAPPAALPEVLSTSHSCPRCYMNRECMTYAAAELKVSPSTTIQGVYKSHTKLLEHFTGHLDEDSLAYFQEWDRLIDLEADASTSMTTIAWLQSSQEQEKATGKCISSLVLDEVATMMANASDCGAGKDRQSALVVLNRAVDSAITTPLSRLNIERGNHVIISSDATSLHLSSRHHEPMTQYHDNRPVGRQLRHRMSIARGVLNSIDDRQVTIRVSRDELSQLSHLNRDYCDPNKSTPGDSQSPPTLRLRVDKDDVSTGTGTLRQNLIKFLTSDVQGAEEQDAASRASKQQCAMSQGSSPHPRERLPWLREAIIHMRPPVFDESLRKYLFDSRGNLNAADESVFLSLALEFSELNEDQRRAVEKIMCARDYSLVQGLPGTGKTSTIAFVARLLAAHGKRVLITSYTHAAIDNLMMKLIENGLGATNHSAPLIRVGNKASCHQNVHSVLASTVATAREGCKQGNDELPSPDSLSSVVSSAKIIGVSALTIPRSALLVGQHFDVVIVDEAGQISQPAILGALMAADSFVLVGDHMQLPPLVQSELAEQGGYSISMLKRLADKHPQSVAQLALQYRMHGDICQLSNDIAYKGKLSCANKDVETRVLSLPGFPSAILGHSSMDPSSCWVTKAIDPSKPVVFLDTDLIRRVNTPRKPADGGNGDTFTQGLERTTGKNGRGNTVNDTEAMLVRQVLHALMNCGLEPNKIGVICPFRSQLRLLEQNPSVEEWKSKGLEVSTIDRYQGRDKPAIVLSLVRSNQHGNCGRLLEDFRRLNVALSRAKHKLIIIGSFKTLTKGSDVLRPVLQKIQQRDQIRQLPENATQSYKQV